MSNTNSPRGFKPIGKVGGATYNGAVTPYRIASAYNTAIYAGDAVKLLSTGYINKAAAGDQIRGIVVGFEWTGSDGIPRKQNYWPASTATLASQDAIAYVIDDPEVEFEAVFTNSTSTPAVADIGALFDLYDAGGSASTGISGEGIDYTTLATTTKVFRFQRFVPRADNDTASAYSRGVFVAALHDYRVNTGI